ncbi:MAG: hypothetical protein M3R30_07080 [Candidatus Eremiobacteraeota bacterium]|nr:hypothetical protein [Candidatus Eremiobacteraeota bacterium]
MTVYLTRVYFTYYASAFAIVGVVTALSIRHPYVWLLPFGFIASVALCGVVYRLASRREFEALHTIGVSGRRFAVPLFTVAIGPQLLWSFLALAIDRHSPVALYVAALCLTGVGVAFAIIVSITWAKRDPGAVLACVLGLTAQAMLVMVGIALASAR